MKDFQKLVKLELVKKCGLGREGLTQKVFLKTLQKFSEHLIHLSKEASKRSQLLAKHAYHHWCFQKLLLFLMFLRNSVFINMSYRTVMSLLK